MEEPPGDGDDAVRHLADSPMATAIERAWDFAQTRELLAARAWDLVLCGTTQRGVGVDEVLELLGDLELSELPVILVTRPLDTGAAIAAMRKGVRDIIFKDDLARLEAAVVRETDRVRRIRVALASLTSAQDHAVATERKKALGQISGGVAHDFNNALTRMLATTELIKGQLPAATAAVGELQEQIGAAAGAVRRLCEFTRADPPLRIRMVDVGQLLIGVREDTRGIWQESRSISEGAIEVAVDVRTDCPAKADESRLRETLAHLMANACDAMRATGGRIDLVVGERRDAIEIQVNDSGSGMLPEVLEHCLDPLYSTRGAEGSGLGLSIADDIVRSIGGTIAVSSQIGVGTSVVLTLRRGTVPAKDWVPVAAVPAPPTDAGLDVLVVDDEPLIAKLVESYLRQLGHRVTTHTSARAAAERIVAQRFDLIVSDRSMPEMSGDALALHVAAHGHGTRFLMVTGYGDLMNANRECPQGVDRVLSKPIGRDALADAIGALFPEPARLVELPS